MKTAAERRSLLNKTMADNIDNGNDCFSCTGICCTSASNSMMITKQEAQDLYDFLKAEDRINNKLIEDLKSNIKRYRLDVQIPGIKQFRRTYTCPFYAGCAKGCTISRHSKPYGCLAFNPLESNQKEGGNCAHLPNVMERQLEANNESADQEKSPIPVALLEIIGTSI